MVPNVVVDTYLTNLLLRGQVNGGRYFIKGDVRVFSF